MCGVVLVVAMAVEVVIAVKLGIGWLGFLHYCCTAFVARCGRHSGHVVGRGRRRGGAYDGCPGGNAGSGCGAGRRR